MGVHELWKILDQKTVKKEKKLSALRNKKLCVDLSGWICEAQCTKALKQNVASPHLQNLLLRVLNLTRRGVKLVFVMDGKPPELKWEAIVKRIQARNGEQSTQKFGSGARVGRSHFEEWARECRTLLNLLGIPCIESEGEAEALCAWLDLNKIVDGCITNDGDAFLYGARTVYKGLSISGKDPSVECYKMEEIEYQLNLNRQNLVALGILLGCDYLPKGVSSVGKEKAMELIRNLKHDNLIDRFYEWTKETNQDNNLSSIEKSVKSKALQDKNFPHPKVIEEFLHPKVNVPETFSFENASPDLQKLQEFCLKNLKWPEERTRKKVLPLLTYWQMTSLLQQRTATLVEPERIIKAQIQQAEECFEVAWKNVELGEACSTSFVTIETKELFVQVYPGLVKEFESAIKVAKLSKKSKSPIGTPRIDSILKSVKKKEETRQAKQQGADVIALSGGGQVVVNLEKPSGKKIKLTVDETKKVKTIMQTEVGVIVRLITDGQATMTVDPETTFKELLGGSDRYVNIVLENKTSIEC